MEGFEYVILDTGPAFSLLALNALLYASEAWIPVAMEYLSLSGLAQVQETLRMVAEELGHLLPVRCVIPTFYDRRTSKARAVLAALQESFHSQLTPPIRANVRLSEAPSYHKSIFDYAPRSPGAEDLRALVEHIDKET
jgi:chromosome partitioning protein